MDTPFFSIIIPTYNRATFLPDTINSVLNQTFQNFELIIIDDASTDNTKEIVTSFNDSKITYYRNENNIERGASRNKGIELAKGKYICFLDSDDHYCANHLQTLFEAVQQNTTPALYFTNSYLLEERHEPVEKIVPDLLNGDVLKYLLTYTPNPARVCIEKSILNECKFDASIPGLEDIDLWLRIAVKYPVKHIPKYTNIYQIHPNSYTLGDVKRYEKELRNFKYIFAKPELKNKLPYNEKKYLFSRCHYFQAIQYFNKKHKLKSLIHSLKAFILFPRGYNVNANKTLSVIILYSFPFMEFIIKKIKKLNK